MESLLKGNKRNQVGVGRGKVFNKGTKEIGNTKERKIGQSRSEVGWVTVARESVR